VAKELPASGEGAPKKSRKKLIIIIVFLLLLILGGMGGVWFFVFDGKMPFGRAPEGPAPGAVVTLPEQDKSKPLGNVVPLPAFTVNLADPLGRRILTVHLALEVDSQEAIADLQRLEPRVRDALIMLLSSKTFADVASADSKMVLKSEITSRVNQVLGAPRVMQTFVTDLIIR
jgi:Flagellar basal body-associated protein